MSSMKMMNRKLRLLLKNDIVADFPDVEEETIAEDETMKWEEEDDEKEEDEEEPTKPPGDED